MTPPTNMSLLKELPEPTPYPYNILPVQCPEPAVLKQLNPWNVQEFFPVELLLRSPTLMDTYHALPPEPDNNLLLFWNHGFTWEVLTGAHHRHLSPTTRAQPMIPGITRITFQEFLLHQYVFGTLMQSQDETSRHAMMNNIQEHFLGFWIDPSLPPKLVLQGLRATVEDRYRATGSAAGHKPNRPYGFTVKTWLDYLNCYDLRMTKGLQYGEITHRVYQKRRRVVRDQAEKAVTRVQRFIHAAEIKQWPPPSSL